MKIITLSGLFGSLTGALIFSLIITIPPAIPFHIWFFSIFGAGIAIMMVAEIIILIMNARNE